jgi:hypothetical protein
MNTTKTITGFTLREDRLMERLKAINMHDKLPERLANWRRWINDPQLYLHELKAHTEKQEFLHG